MPGHAGDSLGRVARKPLSSGTSDTVNKTNMVQDSENIRRPNTEPIGHFGTKQCHDLQVSARSHHFSTTGALNKPLTDVADGHLTTMSTEFAGQEPIGSRLPAIGETLQTNRFLRVNSSHRPICRALMVVTMTMLTPHHQSHFETRLPNHLPSNSRVKQSLQDCEEEAHRHTMAMAMTVILTRSYHVVASSVHVCFNGHQVLHHTAVPNVMLECHALNQLTHVR